MDAPVSDRRVFFGIPWENLEDLRKFCEFSDVHAEFRNFLGRYGKNFSHYIWWVVEVAFATICALVVFLSDFSAEVILASQNLPAKNY